MIFSPLFHTILSHGYEICGRIELSILPYATPYNLLCHCIYAPCLSVKSEMNGLSAQT